MLTCSPHLHFHHLRCQPVRALGITIELLRPTTPDEWLNEIELAIADARESKPFGLLTGHQITDANLFHLSPLVFMKFRGFNFRDEGLRTRVTEGALANYVANSDPDGIDHGLEQRPLMAFAMCYIAAHYVLDLVDEEQATAALDYCEEAMDDG